MKALTICQPYSELIARGEKVIENRTRQTNYRGLLAIHAGKSKSWLSDGDYQKYPAMVFGAIVAVATLSDCQRVHNLPPHLASHEHAHGPWCWVLSDVRRLRQPVACLGQLGLWQVHITLAMQVTDRLAA